MSAEPSKKRRPKTGGRKKGSKGLYLWLTIPKKVAEALGLTTLTHSEIKGRIVALLSAEAEKSQT